MLLVTKSIQARCLIHSVLSCGILPLTWLVYFTWQISGMYVSGDIIEAHAFSHHCCYEAKGSHLNVFDQIIINSYQPCLNRSCDSRVPGFHGLCEVPEIIGNILCVWTYVHFFHKEYILLNYTHPKVLQSFKVSITDTYSPLP